MFHVRDFRDLCQRLSPKLYGFLICQLSPFVPVTFMICVHDFPHGEVSVKVDIMEFGLYRWFLCRLPGTLAGCNAGSLGTPVHLHGIVFQIFLNQQTLCLLLYASSNISVSHSSIVLSALKVLHSSCIMYITDYLAMCTRYSGLSRRRVWMQLCGWALKSLVCTSSS